MFRKELLRAELIKQNKTQADLAKMLGLNKNTVSVKMSTGNFTLNQANAIVHWLKIKKPGEIFFATK